MSPLRLLLAVAMLLPGGCSSLSYYTQAVRGQIGVMAASRPLQQVADDPSTAESVRERLRQLPLMIEFAVGELGLHETRSYRLYADVGRDALVWSVVATPFDSLQPRQWCYPIVGCASYRGYFDRDRANAHADSLAGDGWDVAVEPVPAYSTLGWLSDPLPSTVIDWRVADIAGLVFHELAHETLYVADDSAFNEAYATVIETEGVRRWLLHHGTPQERGEQRTQAARKQDFLALLMQTRGRLADLYDLQPAPPDLAPRKQAIFATLREAYSQLKLDWGGYSGFDRWFERPLNNARLASVGTYHALAPALRLLLQRSAGDLPAFHAACRELAKMERGQRHRYLQQLQSGAAAR